MSLASSLRPSPAVFLLLGLIVAAPALASTPSLFSRPTLAEDLARRSYVPGSSPSHWVAAGSDVGAGGRIFAELGGALLAGAAALPLIYDEPVVGLPLALLGVMLGTYVGGLLAGGEATFLGVLVGGSIGSAVGLALALAGFWPAALLGPVVGSIVGFERSHSAHAAWASRTRVPPRPVSPAATLWKASF